MKIKTKLKEDWSPEQISGRMKMDIGLRICHKTIYRYIYYNKSRGGRLYTYLRHKNKKYHNRSNSYQRRGIIIDRTAIDKRPKIVEKKNRIGDFEINTVIVRHHIRALVTVVDRKSKFTLIKKIGSKRAEEVTTALLELLLPLTEPSPVTMVKSSLIIKRYQMLWIQASILHIHTLHGRED